MGENGSEEGVCRDFLRNVCRRGNRCKFRHPEDTSGVKTELQFCHDFQNKQCTRSNCRYVHCTKEDEEYYLETGSMPPGFVEEGGYSNQWQDGADGDVPVCRDFMKGECKRGSNCKYRHMSRGDIEHEERMRRRGGLGGGPGGRPPFPPPPPIPGPYATEYEHERYRRWKEMARMEGYIAEGGRKPMLPAAAKEKGREVRELEEENAQLRRKNEELRKTITDLTATNDVLLEQNARLRALRAEATSAVLQAETHLTKPVASTASQLSAVSQAYQSALENKSFARPVYHQ